MQLYLCSPPPLCFHGVERGKFAFMWIFSIIESLGYEDNWSGTLLPSYQTAMRVTTWVIVAKHHIAPVLFTLKVPTEQHMAQRAQVYIARYNPCSVTAKCVAGVVRNTLAPVVLNSRWRLPAQGSPTHSGPVPLDFESRTVTLRFTAVMNIQSGAQVPRCYRQHAKWTLCQYVHLLTIRSVQSVFLLHRHVP